MVVAWVTSLSYYQNYGPDYVRRCWRPWAEDMGLSCQGQCWRCQLRVKKKKKAHQSIWCLGKFLMESSLNLKSSNSPYCLFLTTWTCKIQGDIVKLVYHEYLVDARFTPYMISLLWAPRICFLPLAITSHTDGMVFPHLLQWTQVLGMWWFWPSQNWEVTQKCIWIIDKRHKTFEMLNIKRRGLPVCGTVWWIAIEKKKRSSDFRLKSGLPWVLEGALTLNHMFGA